MIKANRRRRITEVDKLSKEWNTRRTGKRNEYVQKMVWMGTMIEEKDIHDVEKFFLDDFGVRMRYIETIITLPGDRHDAVFFIHTDDITKFAVGRFRMGSDCPRWWEDYVDNNREIIPQEYLRK